MSLIDISNLNECWLRSLIDNKVFENSEIEYKDYDFTGGRIDDRVRPKLLKEIAAFANANGGLTIVGIKENDDHLPIELSGTGLTIAEYDAWLSSFRQLVLSRIRPHLHGIECHPVELTDGSLIIVISVIKSYARPHSYWDGNKDEFYIRYANGIAYMDIDDLRKQFLRGESLQGQINLFRQNRISMILANECVGDLGNEAKLVFHIIPEWSFELGNAIELSKFSNNTEFQPISCSERDYRYNADGFCIYAKENNSERINTYTQVFHNGIIEVCEIRMISRWQGRQIYNWNNIQEAIVNNTKAYTDILSKQSVPKPFHFAATLLNAKGYCTSRGGWSSSSVLECDIINSLSGIWREDNTMTDALRPVMDSLANAFGYANSGL